MFFEKTQLKIGIKEQSTVHVNAFKRKKLWIIPSNYLCLSSFFTPESASRYICREMDNC